MQIDKSRLGIFFFLFGFIMLVIFFGTDQSQNPEYLLFFGGAPLTALGIFLIWRHRKPPEPTTRFAGVRRLLNPSKEPPKPKAPPTKKEGRKGLFRILKK